MYTIFSELYDKKGIYRKKYLENLINRFTNASLGVEDIEGDLADTIQAMNIYQQTQALEYALSVSADEQLTINNIKQIEELLTGGEINNFRRTQAQVIGSKVERTKAQYIYMELYNLFDNYYNIWNDLDPFLREAYFHIRFLHIHPFEDGNGRTARILLVRNLCANNQVPCVITKEVKQEYCNYIENNDAAGLAKFFKTIATKELNIMTNIYRNLNEKGLIEDSLMTEEQERKYHELSAESFDAIKGKEEDYPLRNVNNLVKLFKYSASEDDKLKVTGLGRYEHFLDEKSGDVAIYSEENRVMSIGLKGDSRYFRIIQKINELCFEIDKHDVPVQEFEYELQHPVKDEENKKMIKRK